MKLDLREIIEVPGGRVPFRCRLEPEELDFPSVAAFLSPPEAEGEVRNTAGVLTLTGTLHAEMQRICDRCGRHFSQEKTLALEVPLSAETPAEDMGGDADLFYLEDGALDLTEVLETCFILDMEAKCLCREDCKGLCPGCGADLNEGPCACRKSTDPRMAVLEQLLDP